MARTDKRASTALRALLIGTLVFHQPATTAIIVVEDGCSLADAITAANSDSAVGGCPAGSGADEIQLTADIELLAPLPALAGEVIVEGNGFNVHRDETATDFSVLQLTNPVPVAQEPIALRNLSLSNGVAAVGGGIFNEARGPVTITNSTISGNTAAGNGGGIYSAPDSNLTLDNSMILGNYAGGSGGGLASDDARVMLQQSLVSNNESLSAGGGVYADFSYLTLVETTVSNNVAGGSGGGVYSGWYSPLTMTGSTVSGNSAGSRGGGLKLYGSFIYGSLVNSTVSGNVAGSVGGGIFGGGYYYSLGLVNVTITGNSAPSAGGVHFYTNDLGPIGDGSGGFGIYGYLTLGGTIIADNTGGDCVFLLSSPTDLGGNFAGDGSCEVALPIAAGVDFDTILADNGGPTETHALLEGSVAIDASGACGLPTDQRGFPRDDGACDSGSFEFGAGGVGGSVGGMRARDVRCLNVTTGQSVAFALSQGESVWSCEAQGLSVGPGDTVRQSVSGRALDGASGSVLGLSRVGVRCRNLTTGQQIPVPLSSDSWDCVAEGLVVSPHDRIEQQVAGTVP